MTLPTITALPAPPPVTRPMLQPSLFGRGIRNFLFGGEIDHWHAPGVQTWRGETRCAIDAAWLVESVLGTPRDKPHKWPGVPGAADAARWYGQHPHRSVHLRGYQLDGSGFLAERDYGVLTDAPGLGKTGQALCAAEGRLSQAVTPSPTTPVVLILCPALAKRHWQREIKRWTGHDSVILDGLRPDPDVLTTRYVICNYDLLSGLRRGDAAGVMHAREDLPGWGDTLSNRFLIIICDELHILKGRSSQKSKAVHQVAKGVPVVWGLTGTPVPNYTRDLWAQLDLVTGGLFGKYYDFVKTYCDGTQGQYGFIDKGSSNLDQLRGRLSFFMLGRTASSVRLELPPMQRERYPLDVELTAATRADGVDAKSDKKGRLEQAFRRTARAKRSAVIEQALEAVNAGQKVVVFLYTREQCDEVAKAVKNKTDHPVMPVHGDMSPDGRDKVAITFRETVGPACFIATIDSVGMAISLVGADLVIFGDLVPEPWKMYQAELRCYRFDSTKSVLIRYMLATGTIDEHYAESVIAKVENIEAVMGQGGDQAQIGTMFGARSTEEIVEGLFSKLLAMGGDA